MNSLRPLVATLLSAVLLAPAGLAQQSAGVQNRFDMPVPTGNRFLKPYRQAPVAPINLENSNRLEALTKGGKIYLSLEDTLAVALENNLDIELSRYTPQIAQADLLRAQAGGLLRGVPTSVKNTAASVSSQVTGGTTGTGNSSSSSGSSSDSTGGTIITQTGVSVPTLDPTFFVSASASHSSSPQSNTVTTGTNALAYDSRYWATGYQQSFLTGTSYTYSWVNPWYSSNNRASIINPGYNPYMSLSVSQKLLQGFGLAVNNRNIRVAKNNLKVGDLTFKQQVMTTIAGVVNLYWDLVSYNEDAKVKRQALDVAVKFYEDNKKQVEIGTLAPIEIVRAEARVAQAQQDVTNSETVLLQQETVLKNALSRTGVASPSVAEARVVPTDRLMEPKAVDKLEKLNELVKMALDSRPDLEQSRINLTNNKISIAGARSQLLPSLEVDASLQNNGLSGSRNSSLMYSGDYYNIDPFFNGGYSKALGQIFRRNFPNYSVSFSLNIPIRNRTAQADYVRDTLTIRQAELNFQHQLNDVRVAVQNALIAVIQSKARYDSAVKARVLQEQTLDATNKKYALGAATSFEVVQTQRDLAQAQSDEVTAVAAYSHAQVQLDLATAQVLTKYNVEIADAKAGKSSRPIVAR
jgi:outer membrane protein TolC